MKNTAEKLSAVIVVLLFMVFVCNLNAQKTDQHRNKQHNKERIEAQKVAFITDRLDLSVDEAEKFWPVYNNYKDQQKSKQKAWRGSHDFTSEDIKDMTDSEAEGIANKQISHEQEMLDLRKGLITDLKGIISPQKIIMLLEAEKEFRKELMRKVSQGRGAGQGRSEDRK